MLPAFVESILFSFPSRLYLARTVIVAATGALLFGLPLVLWEGVRKRWLILFITIIVHHLISLIQRRILFGILDLLLLLSEASVIAFYACTEGSLDPTWNTEFDILHFVSCWIAFGALVMLAFLRIATLRRTGWKALITPFDILFGYPQSQNKLRYIDVLCGRMIFNLHFTGETSAVISSRGILGLCFLGAIFFYILLTVIFAPILETKYLPVKELRSDAPPLEMKDDVVWNIIPYIISLPKDDIDSDVILSSIDVTSIWDSYTVEQNGTLPCTPVHPPAFQCALYNKGIVRNNTIPESFSSIQITVNFTRLGEGAPIYQRSTPSIVFAIGMSNDSDIEMSVIAKATVPFPLTPGVNLIAAFTLGFRQIFKHPALSGLGLFESSKLFWTSQLTAVYPDPSLTVLRGEDISTIRLFVHDDASPFRTVADYRENSVLDGFSAVGGLWTALSGIFAILFGGSLFHLITGAKPLSIFGAAHSIAHFPAMRKSIMEHYPKLLVRETDGNRGLLEFLRDHLLDLKVLEEPDLEMDEKGSPV